MNRASGKRNSGRRWTGTKPETAKGPSVQAQEATDVYSKKEAAARLRISDQTLHKLTKTGTLRTIKAGRRVLIPRDALLEFLEGK